MSSFLRRLEILNYLSARRSAKQAPASTEEILSHLQDGGYLELEPDNRRTQFRLIQRDLAFLLGEQDEEGEYENDFGLQVTRGLGKSQCWVLEPYQQLSYDFERMPAYMALALALTRKHLTQVLPASVQRELGQVFISAETRLEKSERKLSSSHYRRLANSVEFYQRGQSLQAPEFDMHLLDRLYQAILLGRRVDIQYQGRQGEQAYSLHPYGVVIMLPKLYLVAKKHGAHADAGKGFRSFLVHKIRAVELSRFSAELEEGFDLKRYLAEGNMDVFIDPNDTAQHQLVLDLYVDRYSSLLTDLQESPLAQEQQLEQLGEQHWRLTANVRRTVQLRNWLLGLGAQAKVIAPQVLIDDLLQHLSAQTALYQ